MLLQTTTSSTLTREPLPQGYELRILSNKRAMDALSSYDLSKPKNERHANIGIIDSEFPGLGGLIIGYRDTLLSKLSTIH